jgi:hypothetical protein
MKKLLLKINSQGIGNIISNIMIILIYILKTKKFKKLILINYKGRTDLFDKYCININKKKIHFDNTLKTKGIDTLKSFIKKNIVEIIYNISTSSKNNKTDILLYNYYTPKSNLLLLKNNFNLQPNDIVNNYISKIRCN